MTSLQGFSTRRARLHGGVGLEAAILIALAAALAWLALTDPAPERSGDMAGEHFDTSELDAPARTALARLDRAMGLLPARVSVDLEAPEDADAGRVRGAIKAARAEIAFRGLVLPGREPLNTLPTQARVFLPYTATSGDAAPRIPGGEDIDAATFLLNADTGADLDGDARDAAVAVLLGLGAEEDLAPELRERVAQARREGAGFVPPPNGVLILSVAPIHVRDDGTQIDNGRPFLAIANGAAVWSLRR